MDPPSSEADVVPCHGLVGPREGSPQSLSPSMCEGEADCSLSPRRSMCRPPPAIVFFHHGEWELLGWRPVPFASPHLCPYRPSPPLLLSHLICCLHLDHARAVRAQHPWRPCHWRASIPMVPTTWALEALGQRGRCLSHPSQSPCASTALRCPACPAPPPPHACPCLCPLWMTRRSQGRMSWRCKQCRRSSQQTRCVCNH
jgi:hypothetical protein